MDVNNLTSTLINIGKQLIVPGNNAQKIKYYVEKGDTLQSIARKFNVDRNNIMEMNGLNTRDVIEGQLLIIGKQNR